MKHLNLHPKVEQEINELIDKMIAQRQPEKSYWRIKWRGKFIKINHKTTWLKLGSAKSAFNSEIKKGYQYWSDYIKTKHNNPSLLLNFRIHGAEFLKDILDSKEVEFIQITDP